MKKLLAVTIILLFLSVSVIPSTGTTDVKQIPMPTNSGNTLYVGGSGPNNYTRIQDAIDNASDGDRVFVYDDSSPYYENIEIYKPINLIGEEKNTTIIDGSWSGEVVHIEADCVNIKGFTIQNSSPTGIVVYCSYENIISDNIIRLNQVGIILFASSMCIIKNNIITSNQIGISGYGYRMFGICYENLISGNIISHNNINGIHCGERFYDSDISNNIITKNRYGLAFDYNASRNYCTMNNITYNLVGLITTSVGTVIEKNNFIENKRHAKHMVFIGGEKLENIWNKNYWGKPRKYPYPISGRIGIEFCIFPWFPQFDWHPAKEPYDIGV